MNAYEDALAALYSRTAGGVRLGLERTRGLLAELGDPQLRFGSIHIAGTNGKGSVVATITAVLRSRGFRVGAYTSPHLVDFRERVLVDGVPISMDRVVAFAKEWLPVCDRLQATFFEATTALAFADFAERGVEVAVVETGLGGRLDATNVLSPEVAAVTSVARDHTELLGETLESIAAEKAGIFKRGVPAVIGEHGAELSRELARHAQASGAASVIRVRDTWEFGQIDVNAHGTHFSVERGAVRGLVRTPLAGRHQAVNTLTALAVLDVVRELPALEELNRALADVRLAGRFQCRGRFIFDVAHNVSSAAALADTLTHVQPPRPLVALVAVLSDKDWRGMLSVLAPTLDLVVCTVAPSAPVDRKWDPAAVAGFVRELGGEAEYSRDFDNALARVCALGASVLVTGSFHTVGDAMSRLQISPLDT